WQIDGGTIEGGSITTTEGATLEFTSNYENSLDGVTLDIEAQLDNYDQVRIDNGLTVNGTLTAFGNGDLIFNSDSSGQLLGGTGDLIFNSDQTVADNQIRIEGDTTLTIGSELTLSGGNLTINSLNNNGTSRLLNLGTIRADLINETIVIDPDLFENKGTLEALENSIVEITGNYTQTAGITNLQDGTLDITGMGNIENGSLVGSGTINATEIINDSLLNPGHSTGILNLNGNYTQTIDGILNIEIGGTNDFDKLDISNTANLSGNLDISLVNNYTPMLGDSFEILTFGAHLGDFTNVNLPSLSNGLEWDTQLDTNSFTLTVV
ncbi:MAG TPA: hypothetical protein DCF68_08835, partial [Cyanothece sp. UBA12306]|nr:hypothetical protein [Cyanothece sp. UBA12306]